MIFVMCARDCYWELGCLLGFLHLIHVDVLMRYIYIPDILLNHFDLKGKYYIYYIIYYVEQH